MTYYGEDLLLHDCGEDGHEVVEAGEVELDCAETKSVFVWKGKGTECEDGCGGMMGVISYGCD